MAKMEQAKVIDLSILLMSTDFSSLELGLAWGINENDFELEILSG